MIHWCFAWLDSTCWNSNRRHRSPMWQPHHRRQTPKSHSCRSCLYNIAQSGNRSSNRGQLHCPSPTTKNVLVQQPIRIVQIRFSRCSDFSCFYIGSWGSKPKEDLGSLVLVHTRDSVIRSDEVVLNVDEDPIRFWHAMAEVFNVSSLHKRLQILLEECIFLFSSSSSTLSSDFRAKSLFSFFWVVL